MLNLFINDYKSLVTTQEQIRKGFLQVALEKNMVSDPFIRNAYAFKSMVSNTRSVDDLLNIDKIKPFLVAASGISEKSLAHLTDNDKDYIINEFIENKIKPSSYPYVDNIIYHYLLAKGDSIGGLIRNRIGSLGQEKLIRHFLSCLSVRGIQYKWKKRKSSIWKTTPVNDLGIEKDLKEIYWKINNNDRILTFNRNIKIVNKNVDICLVNSNPDNFENGKILLDISKILMIGELKSGIDPAGADEHWKTANTSLERVRNSFKRHNIDINTSFIAAAIENSMAKEIYEQLKEDKLNFAANLNNDDQMTEYCNWILDFME